MGTIRLTRQNDRFDYCPVPPGERTSGAELRAAFEQGIGLAVWFGVSSVSATARF